MTKQILYFSIINFSFLVASEKPLLAADTTTLDKVIISAKRTTSEEIHLIAEKENEIGYSDDVSKILFLTPGVSRIPQAGSSLIVHGEGPFDNTYYVNEIRMFAPSHFSNHAYSDVNGVPITTLNNVEFITENSAGRYYGGSGGIIKLNPGIVRLSDKVLKLRPELGINCGMLEQTFLLTAPFRQYKDCYQLTFTTGNLERLLWQSNRRYWNFDLSGNGAPLDFSDVAFTGDHYVNGLKISEYIWYAKDYYRSKVKGVPWGMATVTLSDTSLAPNVKVTVGGVKQKHFDSKQLGQVEPQVQLDYSDFSCKADYNEYRLNNFWVDFTARCDYMQYNGSGNADSSYWLGSWYFSRQTNPRFVSNSETNISLQTSIHTPLDFGSCGLNILAGYIYPGNRPYVDPGLWIKTLWGGVNFSANAGIQTSQPDIRGLPDNKYRAELQKTYRTSCLARLSPASFTDVTLQVFAKYRNKCPARSENVAELWWDPALQTPLLARGVDFEWNIQLFKQLSLQVIQNFSRSERIRNDTYTTYEWDIPWTNRTTLHYAPYANTLDLYISGVFAKGLPYRNVVESSQYNVVFDSTMYRVPVYHTIDFEFQFRQPIEKHRYITRFDAYLIINNALSLFDGMFSYSDELFWQNIREYSWDYSYKRMPVELDGFTANVGIRLGFRL